MHRRRILISCFAALALLGAAGGYFALRYEPGADGAFDTRVPQPLLTDRRPRVLFDAGHRNSHSIRGRYAPFAGLIRSDGCRVAVTSDPFSAGSLATADILVVVNAKGPEPDSASAAFSPDECDAVHEWGQAGGSLLLVADHHPCGPAAAALAASFGVDMGGGWTDDEVNARQGSGDPGQLLFTRQSGRLADHAITRGRSPSDPVSTVETFTGQSLKGPEDAAPLLLLADTAVDRIPISAESTQQGSQTITAFKTDDRSAAGRCQGLALRSGKGRVVVLAEAAMLTAQIDDKTGARFGMNAPDNDNRAFTLNVVRWLAGGLDGERQSEAACVGANMVSTGWLWLAAALGVQAPEEYAWPADKPATVKQFADETGRYLGWMVGKGFCGVVLVAEKGTVHLHQAYGLSDRERALQMTVPTGFDIGSIVKPMTKAAVVKLESEGKLSLSDKLSKHFDQAPADKAEITLLQVVEHKAGFPDIFGDDYEAATRDWVVEKCLSAPLISPPGEKFNYSNAGYSLLGALIEKISGRPYERYMVDEILAPAGVKRIGYRIPGWKSDELAVGYREGKRWGTPLDKTWMEDGPSWNLRANGGMLSSVEELHRWFDAVLAGRVLSSEATKKYRDMMFRPGSLGERVIGAAGGNGVFNSLYVNIDDIGLVFVLFTNDSRTPAEEVSKPLRARLEKLAGNRGSGP